MRMADITDSSQRGPNSLLRGEVVVGTRKARDPVGTPPKTRTNPFSRNALSVVNLFTVREMLDYLNHKAIAVYSEEELWCVVKAWLYSNRNLGSEYLTSVMVRINLRAVPYESLALLCFNLALDLGKVLHLCMNTEQTARTYLMPSTFYGKIVSLSCGPTVGFRVGSECIVVVSMENVAVYELDTFTVCHYEEGVSPVHVSLYNGEAIVFFNDGSSVVYMHDRKEIRPLHMDGSPVTSFTHYGDYAVITRRDNSLSLYNMRIGTTVSVLFLDGLTKASIVGTRVYALHDGTISMYFLDDDKLVFLESVTATGVLAMVASEKKLFYIFGTTLGTYSLVTAETNFEETCLISVVGLTLIGEDTVVVYGSAVRVMETGLGTSNPVLMSGSVVKDVSYGVHGLFTLREACLIKH
jgi:hypothetical protein